MGRSARVLGGVVTPEQVAAIVAATTAAQGLPLKVTDLGVVRDVVTLLGGSVGSGPVRSRRERRADPQGD